eukprot:350689-Chlamydomonas_euryale.AAC.3
MDGGTTQPATPWRGWAWTAPAALEVPLALAHKAAARWLARSRCWAWWTRAPMAAAAVLAALAAIRSR